MGIKYFTGFVNQHFNSLFQKKKFSDFKDIVVDGNGLCHQLYYRGHCDWQLGGEYPDFYSKVKDFFEQIRGAGVKPVVIFDGSHDQSKTKTVLKRKEDKNIEILKSQESGRPSKTSVSPILMLQTFIDAVEDLKIQFYVASSEGDNEIAALANYLCCPVLSTDSDYFMFDLKYGYIPFDNFSVTSCYVYSVDYFTDLFHLKNAKFRLFIPALHGNDFLRPYYATANSLRDFRNTLRTVSAYRSCEACLQIEYGPLVHQNFKAAEKQYCNPKSPSYEDLKASFIRSYGLPEWTFDYFRDGCFHPHLLDIKMHNVRTLGNVVEDIKKESAWLCSRYIRQHIYGFIGLSASVKENIRREALPNMVTECVTPRNVSPPVALKDIQIGGRKDLVLSVLSCCNIPADTMRIFDHLEDKWKLPIATVVYWFRKSGIVTEHLVKSLLLCFLHCSGVQSHSQAFPVPEQQASLPALHAFAQWQCIYYDAMVLNNIVRKPFATTSPSSLFSGKVAMFYASSTSEYIDSIIPREALFLPMFKFATYCVEEEVLLVSYDRDLLQSSCQQQKECDYDTKPS